MTQNTPDPMPAKQKADLIAQLTDTSQTMEMAIMQMTMQGMEPPKELLEDFQKVRAQLDQLTQS